MLRSLEPFNTACDVDVTNLPPTLCVLVDAEEDFQWDRPVSPQNDSVESIKSQILIHKVFERYKIKPTYLVTYPLAVSPLSTRILKEFLNAGLCDLGAQLHPWVTPPLAMPFTDRFSFPGNLPARLEQEKLRVLTEAIRDNFAVQPVAYKAGRYGLGERTADIIEALGYLVDTSLAPLTSYRSSGGPDYLRFDYKPFWFGKNRRILQLPLTRSAVGTLTNVFSSTYARVDGYFGNVSGLKGLLARSQLAERITLSPEGNDLKALIRLTDSLIARGQRIFTLSYHSPSLAPGNTPYVRNQRDLADFLDRVAAYCDYFHHSVGGRFATVRELYYTLAGSGGHGGPAAVTGQDARPPRQAKCLLVANTFPPILGGSATVYSSIARFNANDVAVLAPWRNYQNGRDAPGWRAHDRKQPYTVYRLPLLRTVLTGNRMSVARRLRTALDDIRIKTSLLLTIRSIIRHSHIRIICIGELVAGGWLVYVCQYLLRCASIIYVHGEELSTRTGYDKDGSARARVLQRADAVVCVSGFTKDLLTSQFGMDERRVALLVNGVDYDRLQTSFPWRISGMIAPPSPSLQVLSVGRLQARKGVDRVIEGLHLCLERLPALAYGVVGEGSYEGSIARLVKICGHRGSVTLHGSVPEPVLSNQYRNSLIFVMPNRELPDGDTEGFGLVFLEANAGGVPAIAGCDGGSVDAVLHLRNGLVVNGQNPSLIGTAVQRVLTAPRRYARLSRGSKTLAYKASWKSRARDFARLCATLGSRR